MSEPFANRALDFARWMERVNEYVLHITGGLTIDELDDCDYADQFQTGTSPERMALRALRHAGWPE